MMVGMYSGFFKRSRNGSANHRTSESRGQVEDGEALWASLEGVSFLTDDEKRIAAGYLPLAEGALGKHRPFDIGAKYRPNQRSCPVAWCKSAGHGLSSKMARAVSYAAAMRLRPACGSSLIAASFSRLM